MKFLIALCTISLLIGSYAFAEPKMNHCQCKNCACTTEKHCGCYSEEGCHCKGGNTCSITNDKQTGEADSK